MPEYNSLSDSELVALLREGDSLAYTAIYNRYKGLLYIFAYRRIHNREEAKDIIHELFLSIWVKRSDLYLTSSLPAYLYTSVRNAIIDLISHKKVSLRYIESFQQYILTEDNNTDHLVRHNALKILIDKEIDNLPRKMRQVFELSRKASFSRRQIAQELEISEQTVKSHMHLALKILRTKFGSLISILLFLT